MDSPARCSRRRLVWSNALLLVVGFVLALMLQPPRADALPNSPPSILPRHRHQFRDYDGEMQVTQRNEFDNNPSRNGDLVVSHTNNPHGADHHKLIAVSRSLRTVQMVALANLVINALRPDPNISWQARFPRLMWELSIAVVASRSHRQYLHMLGGNSPSSTSSHSGVGNGGIYLLLSLMTGSTSFIDIFWWSSIFAYFATFETCTVGGWFFRSPRICQKDYLKGFGRLLVSAQSMGNGIIYLMGAISAWGAFVAVRDEDVKARDTAAFERAMAGRGIRG